MSLRIAADFDAGNIEVASVTGGGADLRIRRDAQSDFYQWFYFRVDGAAAGAELTFRILNGAGAAYPFGWPGYRACVSDDDSQWRRADTSYADGVLTIRHRPAGERLWVAYFAPYSTARHQQLVARCAASPLAEHRVLGETLDGRPLDLIRVGAGPRQVWLYARQHPGETMAEWWMEGALDLLLSDDPVAAELRAAATFHAVPNMNPDGSARGHLRTNAAGVNLNREWHTPSRERSPEVFHVREAMDASGVDFAIDVHGDEAIPHVFMAGFEGIPGWRDAQGVAYHEYLRLLAETSPDFQTKHGYPVAAPGQANLSMSTNQLAERYGAVSMTLEMPFKDHDDRPDPVEGWSPRRSAALGQDCLRALAAFLPALPAR